ncbi:MAG TPA: PAS domain S-box protein [Vicinamibacterales bacterium]|nr:PAS domain S-box protein [Vicinamibacterales bacterium]
MASWPQSLRTTVSLVQASNSPISLVWGHGHVQIYNDGYWPICGAKHPTAMGQDFRECWASAFPVIGEAYASAWSGQSAYLEKMRMFLERYGFLEETWFTFSFSPITDESGRVAGLFHPVTEMTTQMLSERRGRTLRELASRAGKAKTMEEAFALATEVLSESNLDMPFFLLYLIDEEAKSARLVGQHGLQPGTPANPERVDLRATGRSLWSVAEVARTGLTQQMDDAATRLTSARVGPYPEVPKTALALPILHPGREKPVAVLVAGVSSRLAMTETYRDFYDLIAAAVGATVANAGAYESERKNAGPLQSAIFNSANFSSIATDAKGVIQIFNVGAERMLGYTAAEVMNKITPADISDPQEVVARAKALSLELGTPITPGFEALVFKASRGIEDIYELTYIRKDGSRFPAVVSVTALRDAQNAIIGYLLIGTDNTARKQAEEALLKAGALQSAIFNSANFSSIATDAKGVIQIFNVGAERMLGYTAAEVMNKITPADISDPQEVILRAKALSVELGTPITPGFEALVFKASRGIEDIYELTYFRKDGSRFPAVVSVTALRDAQNAIIGYLLIGTDNTARKQAEEALLKAGALQSAIFNSANFSSIATDAKGVIQIFNVGAERMLGYTAAEVMNKITPADISDPQEVIGRAKALSVELGTPITPGFEALVFKASRGIEDIYELTYFRKDGSRFPAVVSVTALRDAQNAIIGYLLIGTDNTARKQIEEERKKLDQRLRDQHFYTRSLIESNIDALMTCDPRGIITDVNKQTETLTGCTRDELIGAPFKNYFTDPVRAETGINQVLAEGKVTNYELTARARDGTQTVVSYNATTFHDRDRSLQGVFAAARDMTELKRFEQKLQQKNLELEDASRMKSEFLANMSHELRTPLNAIIGFSEVLKDGLMGEMTEKQRGFIRDIFGSGKHLLALINDILDLSKVEAGKMTLDLESMPLSPLLVNSLSIIREKAGARHIRLDLDLAAADALGSIQADPRKVKQILYNLLSNAVKFSSEGGEVRLRASRVGRAEVGRLSNSKTGRSFPLADNAFSEFLKISVTDTGIGISQEGLAQLFRPFSQIDSGLARKFEGTGLGLAMVKLLIDLHGGTVAVESVVGDGSCFTVWLPLRDAAEEELTAVRAAPAIEAPAGPRTALVVEDDYKSAELIRVQLEAEGFTVLHAASAEAALVLAVQQPLSLITLDIMLPHMDGWEFLERLKQVPGLARIPVVIISIVADRNRGFALGAAAVMQKPISRQELYDSLVDLGLFPVPQGETLDVLVVDDDPIAVELIAVRFLGLAKTVHRAFGGQEAIDIARRELPDLIVLDLMMPDVNGFDVVEALKGQPDTARIPILVVTAKQITADDRAKLNGYVSTIMEKPGFDNDRFTAEVRRATSRRRLAA